MPGGAADETGAVARWRVAARRRGLAGGQSTVRARRLRAGLPAHRAVTTAPATPGVLAVLATLGALAVLAVLAGGPRPAAAQTPAALPAAAAPADPPGSTGGAASTTPAPAGSALPPLVGEGARLGPGWRVAGLPRQKMPLTRYGVARVDGVDALRIEAAASYGNLVHDMPGRPAPARLRWRWRLDEPNAAVDLSSKAGDDAAVKVCLAFELPLERVPFVERQLLRLARAQSGEPLPAATLCWVWGGAEARGAAIDNPYSRRVRVIVLRNRGDGNGRWFEEDRDVAADWRRAFGDESAQVPPLAAVIVAADADNTGGASVAHVAGLRFGP